MKILIIGGTGLVGGNLRRHLSKKYKVSVTSRSAKDSALIYDVERDNLLDVLDEKYDVLINNIAPTNLTLDSTKRGVLSVVKYCKKYSAHLIHVSSFLASKENRDINSYTKKKAYSEELILSEMDSRVTILRFPQLFDYEGLARGTQGGLYYVADRILKGEEVSLFQNKEECVRNYLPIELLNKIIDYTIDNKLFGLHNAYFNDFTLTLEELVEKLFQVHYKSLKDMKVVQSDKLGFSFKIDFNNSVFETEINRNNIDYYFTKFLKNI